MNNRQLRIASQSQSTPTERNPSKKPNEGKKSIHALLKRLKNLLKLLKEVKDVVYIITSILPLLLEVLRELGVL